VHLLVAIGGNRSEWRDALGPSADRPRLPLPYAFGAAFLKRGHKVSAVDLAHTGLPLHSQSPFETVYSGRDWVRALKQVDLGMF